MRLSTLLRELLGVQETVVESATMEAGVLVVAVRPRWRQRNRCGICRKKCKLYDRGSLRRRWRGLDLGTTMVYLVADLPRVRCPRHGVVASYAPWARHRARFTTPFENQVAWLATQCSKTAVCELMRVTWRTVGRVITRVAGERGSTAERLRKLRRIGIDEISYRKGHRYLTVVVDHDTGELVWAAEGKSSRTLGRFFDELGEEGCQRIEVVSRDAAEWIKRTVTERCPQAIQCMDPFHVVQWATAAVDKVRRQAWRKLREDGWTVGARNMKQTRWALLKNPENLNSEQEGTLSYVRLANDRLYRAYLLKEELRLVFQSSPDEGEELLEHWLQWARRCRIPEMVAVAKSVTNHREGILSTLKYRVSNARIEATNTGIRLITRRAYGFHSAEPLIALAMLSYGGRCPPLPGRV